MLVILLCGWAVVVSFQRLWSNVTNSRVVDQTMSETTKENAPGLFVVQVVGLVLVVATASLIGIGAIVRIVQLWT